MSGGIHFQQKWKFIFFFRGHGTYVDGDKLIASVAGIVDRVNKLICVRPFKTRYTNVFIYILYMYEQSLLYHYSIF